MRRKMIEQSITCEDWLYRYYFYFYYTKEQQCNGEAPIHLWKILQRWFKYDTTNRHHTWGGCSLCAGSPTHQKLVVWSFSASGYKPNILRQDTNPMLLSCDSRESQESKNIFIYKTDTRFSSLAWKCFSSVDQCCISSKLTTVEWARPQKGE